MESDNLAWKSEREFVEIFYELRQAHGKSQHFWVEHGLKNFLQLGETGDDGEILIKQKFAKRV